LTAAAAVWKNSRFLSVPEQAAAAPDPDADGLASVDGVALSVAADGDSLGCSAGTDADGASLVEGSTAEALGAVGAPVAASDGEAVDGIHAPTSSATKKRATVG
jgi:hypothetical protein